jgi:hypothetical protein
VIKDSKGYELRYAHLSSRSVSAGASVTKGDEIGLVGNTGNSTGSHLHIELLKNGERLNPIFYLETGEGTGFGGNEYTSEAAQRLLEEAAKYLGTPYVWGGYSPSGFDCSGFVSYCLVHSGVRNTGRLTAQGLYNICTPVSQSEAQPGDLIFFTGTYDATSNAYWNLCGQWSDDPLWASGSVHVHQLSILAEPFLWIRAMVRKRAV